MDALQLAKFDKQVYGGILRTMAEIRRHIAETCGREICSKLDTSQTLQLDQAGFEAQSSAET